MTFIYLSRLLAILPLAHSLAPLNHTKKDLLPCSTPFFFCSTLYIEDPNFLAWKVDGRDDGFTETHTQILLDEVNLLSRVVERIYATC
jgi:hypothetical protein